MIDLKKAYYSYLDIPALVDINLHVSKGESIAFIGPNGSGKSTLMKLINGIVNPDSGIYEFNGEAITPKKLQDAKFSKAFHKKIGFVFQNADVQLFCSNVYDEIAFGLRQMGLDEQQVAKRVNDCLKLLHIEELEQRQPYHLSGGEKRKVTIACVLALNPEVLVLDEPMNGLDPKTKRFLRELMVNLNDAGKTILCATHDFEYVEGIFKRAIAFSNRHTIIRDDDYHKIINDKAFLYDSNII